MESDAARLIGASGVKFGHLIRQRSTWVGIVGLLAASLHIFGVAMSPEDELRLVEAALILTSIVTIFTDANPYPQPQATPRSGHSTPAGPGAGGPTMPPSNGDLHGYRDASGPVGRSSGAGSSHTGDNRLVGTESRTGKDS